jgi:cysteinyl-tRNA synthetase
MLAVLALDNLLEPGEREPPPEVLELLKQRELARRAHDFEQADRIRERIGELGWEVRDGPSGPELMPPER